MRLIDRRLLDDPPSPDVIEEFCDRHHLTGPFQQIDEDIHRFRFECRYVVAARHTIARRIDDELSEGVAMTGDMRPQR